MCISAQVSHWGNLKHDIMFNPLLMNLLTLFLRLKKSFYIPPTLFPRYTVFSFISADELTADQVMWSLCCVTAGMWARAAPHTRWRVAQCGVDPRIHLCLWGWTEDTPCVTLCFTSHLPHSNPGGYDQRVLPFLKEYLGFPEAEHSVKNSSVAVALVKSARVVSLWNGWRDAAVTVADAKRLTTVGSQTGKRVWDRTTLIV